jgi:hypothetical protein
MQKVMSQVTDYKSHPDERLANSNAWEIKRQRFKEQAAHGSSSNLLPNRIRTGKIHA